MQHYEHTRYDWLNEQVCRIGDVVFSGIPDPNSYLDSLPKGDQCAFYVGKLISQVGNGGIHEYVSGPYADDIDCCIDCLSEIGANSVSDSLKRLRAYLPLDYLPLDREGRDSKLFDICDKNGVETLDELVFVDVEAIDLEALYFYCTQVTKSG